MVGHNECISGLYIGHTKAASLVLRRAVASAALAPRVSQRGRPRHWGGRPCHWAGRRVTRAATLVIRVATRVTGVCVYVIGVCAESLVRTCRSETKG